MNITCISDIHLNTFTSHEFYPGFRDEQYSRAADRVIEISEKSDSRILCILGDLIDSPVITPPATHLLVSFVEKMAGYYDKIYYILGQHDVSSKVRDWREEDTIVTVLSKITDKMEYANRKIVEIGGRKIYFRDFQFETDTIDDTPECDVFLGHVTLSDRFGQTISPQPYKVGIFGDIHHVVDMGKNHSVGGFLQKNMSDTQFGNVVTLDLDTLKFRRDRLIDENHKFLRIYNEGDKFEPDEFTVVNKKEGKVDRIEIKDANNEVREVKLTDLDDVVLGRLEKEGLMDIHKKIVQNCKLDDRVYFDFNLKSLKIHNFRSIKDYSIDFEKFHGLTFISGDNGSGKSSLVSALLVALTGSRRIKSFCRIGTKDLKLDLELEFHGITYRIVRGPGKTEFYVNGEESSKGSKTELDLHIANTLPFISHLGMFLLTIKPGYAEKLLESKLINKLFGIDNFVQYYEISKKSIKELNKRISTIRETISANEGRLVEIASRANEISNALEAKSLELASVDVSRINMIPTIAFNRRTKADLLRRKASVKVDPVAASQYESLKNSRKEYDEVVQHNEKARSIVSRIRNAQIRIAGLEKDLANVGVGAHSATCPDCGSHFLLNANEIEERRKFIEGKILSEKNELETLKSSVVEEIDIAPYMEKVRKMNECLASAKSIAELEQIVKQVEECEAKEAGFPADLNSMTDTELKEMSNRYVLLKGAVEEYSRQKLNVVRTKESIESEISKGNIILSDAEKDLERLSLYNSVFDETSENSIHREVMLKISKTLSDDVISFVSENSDGGEIRLQMNVCGNLIDYENCSDGQKTFVDMCILGRLVSLIGGIGAVFLDEVLGSIKSENIEKYLQIIRSFNANNIFMISHNMTVTGDFDSRIDCELVDGISIFK